jgi:sulfatase maturation enzyme AslB (radical SAM superfamily)
LGLSLDGPPQAHDQYRVTRDGEATSSSFVISRTIKRSPE